MSAGRAGQDSAAAGNAAAGDFDVDLFVIGAGSGGVRAARFAAGFGARVAVAESRYLGGADYSIADVAVFPNVALGGDGGLDLAAYPALQAWFARVRALPGSTRPIPSAPAWRRQLPFR